MMHPRPHLRRAARLDLDGTWQFALDPDDRGEREAWFRGRAEWPATIVVPFPWESPRAGLGGSAPTSYVRGSGAVDGGTGWYRRVVHVPPSWADQRQWLVVGAAYWHTRVWIDGVLAIEHDGGYDPFEVDVTDLIAGRSTAELVIRVWAPPDTDEYPHGKNTRHWYSRASGIWQSVFLEPRPATHVATLRVVPDLERAILGVAVGLRSERDGQARISISLHRDDVVVARETKRVALAAGIADHASTLEVPSPRPWSLADPALYDVRVTVASDGDVADIVETSVGFRTIAFERSAPNEPVQFVLNGEAHYLRAVMSQGYHPDGILAYPDEEVIRRDLESAKELGFNMVRLHVKLDDPRVLAWADRLGILLWCEVPNYLTPTDAARRRWEQVWRTMILRDSGHPSVALWCMFIESWGLGTNQFGFGGATRAFADDRPMQAWVEEMYLLGRSLDATRPIIENSTSEGDHTIAEVNDVHLFPVGYGGLRDVVEETLDDWLDRSYPGSSFNFTPGHVQADQPLMVSSMAGWSSVDGVETSWPLRVLINEVRARDRICGYGWVQLYDVEWELTGVQTYDRGRKDLGFKLAELNADDVLVVLGPLARAARPGSTVIIDVALADGCGRGHEGLTLQASAEGLDDDWQPWSFSAGPTLPEVRSAGRGTTRIGSASILLPERAVAGRVRIQLNDGDGVTVARTLVNLAALPVQAVAGPGPTNLPLARWASMTGEPPGSIDLDGVPGRIDAATLFLEMTPDDIPASPGSLVVLDAEAAIWAGGPAGQFDQGHSGPVEARLDGVVVARLEVPVVRADSRATLSIVNPVGAGTYGARLRVPLGPAEGLAGRAHSLSLSATGAAGERIVLFGPNLGVAPVGPRLRREP